LTAGRLKPIIELDMKYRHICRLLASGIIIALLLSVFASGLAAGASVDLSPDEGKIGDWVDIEFKGDETVRFYFSSDEADIGDTINNDVTAYYFVGGNITFKIPERLEDGTHKEDVYGGEHYLYAVAANKEIVAFATFTVIMGEIWLEPEEGSVGDEVLISGEGLRREQALAVEYDGDDVEIISGGVTDNEGNLSCLVVIPDSVIGEHSIVVADESGDKPEVIFTVKPKITLVPPEQEGGKGVEVMGTGFGAEYPIELAIDGVRVETTPYYVETNFKGSFKCVFEAPFYDSPTLRVAATDRHLNKAEAQLTVLASIRFDEPITSESPGHAGMEVTIYGIGYASGATIDITYSEGDEVISRDTATADADGNFTTLFVIPPSVAGSHTIKATDGATNGTITFFMESKAPKMPVLRLPEPGGTTKERVRFDWEDVADPSGVSYDLQVASGVHFNDILLEKKGLPTSEYTLTDDEELAPAGSMAYYWRVKSVDGASNESGWSPIGLFYVSRSGTAMTSIVWYIVYGVIGLVVLGLIFWLYRRRKA